MVPPSGNERKKNKNMSSPNSLNTIPKESTAKHSLKSTNKI